MKNFALAAFAIALAATSPAWAQQHPQPSHPPAAPHPAPAGGPGFHPSPASHPAYATATHRPATATHHYVVHHTYHHPVTHHVVHHVVRHITVHHVARAVGHHPVAIAHLRRNVVAVHRFHAGLYRAPPGYQYRRWVFGERLPAIYYARDYWLTDFLAFGLFGPPDGYVWVRYGPDALLIDEYTGEIIQVDYGVFY